MAIIPATHGQVNLLLGGTGYPRGAEIVFGITRPGELTPAEFGAALNPVVQNELVPGWPQAVTYLGCLVKYGPNDTGPFAEVSFNVSGGGGAMDVQPQVACLIRKITLLGGRKGQGRIYGPIGEGQVGNAGVIPPQTVGDFQVQWLAFLAALATLEASMVLLHNDPADVPTPVVSVSVSATCATQRRRLRG